MTRSTWASQRVPTAALLILALTITTGWTPAAARTTTHERLAGFATEPVDGIAISHGAPASRQLAALVASRAGDLAAHRVSEATLFASARALYQARVTASRVAPAPVVKAKAPAKAKAPVAKAPAPKPATRYAGTNHFWFPALGMSRPVYLFACTRTREPANYVYRWGCAGRNNVYLLGHAWGVFKPLHDAYLSGRLRVGMVAYYADGKGRVRKYKVTTWRVVNPTNSSWAIASQPVPSMTLQTCVGLNRLNVRLVAVN